MKYLVWIWLVLFTTIVCSMQNTQHITKPCYFVVPKHLKLSSVIHNAWYRKIEAEDDDKSTYERTIPLGSGTSEVVRVSYDTKGKLLESSILYKAKDPESARAKTVWKIKKVYNKKRVRCQLVKPCLCIMGFVIFFYALCNGPLQRQATV